MDRRQKQRSINIIGGALVFSVAAAYAVYKFYTSTQSTGESRTQTRYTKRRISIILTDSIIASELPINEILNMASDVVLVVPPGLSIDDLNEKLDPTVAHKVIECDTNSGVWSVAKHLTSEILFVVTDDLPKEIPDDIHRYVGDVVELDQNLSVINKSILSSIFT